MTAIDGVIVGALGAAAIHVGFLALRKTWRVATSMDEALRAVPLMLKVGQDLVAATRDFQRELQMMRHIATGVQSPNFGEDEPGATPPNPIAPRAPITYPSVPPYGAYPIKQDAPDAEPGDTVVFAQTDEEAATEERLENLIEMGLAHREEVMPPGREVESN